MLYGLTGSSGSGKTTLGRAIGESLNIHFMETSVTSMAQSHGYNPVSVMPLKMRLDMQEKILADLEVMIRELKGPAILDRTPIDMATYLLAETGMYSHMFLDAEELRRVEEYVLRCIEFTKAHFDMVFLTEPLHTYEVAETRPALNLPYQLHCHFLMRGLITHLTGQLNHAIIPPMPIEDRVELTTRVIAQRLNSLTTERQTTLHLH